MRTCCTTLLTLTLALTLELTLGLSVATHTFAQEPVAEAPPAEAPAATPPVTEAPAAEAPPADVSPNAEVEFNAAGTEYRQVFQEIETLRGEYQTASDARRKEINATLPALVETGRQKMARWTNASLALYKAAPNQNAEVSELLLAMAQHMSLGQEPPQATGGDYFGGDQYEQALPIIETLVDGGHPEQELLIWGGVTAVCCNDYDRAKKFLEAANAAGLFGGLPQYPNSETSIKEQFQMKARDWFVNLAEMRANWEAEAKIREAEAAADDLPRVKFTTTKGDVVIELFENEAPIATANMVSLVKAGFYTNIKFHRVLPHFMAQGGDPTGTGSGGPGHNIRCECSKPNARKHFRGTLSMAHAGKDTGGSQFFMCFVPTDFLNGRHTSFGRVVEGMEVLGNLQRIDPSAGGPFPNADRIIKAEVVRDRGHAYKFEKLPEH